MYQPGPEDDLKTFDDLDFDAFDLEKHGVNMVGWLVGWYGMTSCAACAGKHVSPRGPACLPVCLPGLPMNPLITSSFCPTDRFAGLIRICMLERAYARTHKRTAPYGTADRWYADSTHALATTSFAK